MFGRTATLTHYDLAQLEPGHLCQVTLNDGGTIVFMRTHHTPQRLQPSPDSDYVGGILWIHFNDGKRAYNSNIAPLPTQGDYLYHGRRLRVGIEVPGSEGWDFRVQSIVVD